MKLFAAALYAHKNSFWSSDTSYVGVASIVCNSEQEAEEMALNKVHEQRPESQGWENHQVFLTEISPSRALSVLSH